MTRSEPAPSPEGTIRSTLEAPPAEVRLVSVNVARPRVIGTRRGWPVLSGIGKRPVATDTLVLDLLNLEGDGQADLSVHGGPDKAVYAYPSEHLPTWNRELDVSFGPATFGENLTTEGAHEDEVRIGDVWAWGEARLQVTQPRSPCYKLAIATNRPDLGKRMVANGRTGWYLRVLAPGPVPVGSPIFVAERDPAGVTVLAAHRALFDADATRADLEAVAAVDALAGRWRGAILERLAQP